MTTVKECIAELGKRGIDGTQEPIIGILKYFCVCDFDLYEIVLPIIAAEGMLHLNAMLPDGDKLTPDEKKLAIKMLKEGKTVVEVFKELRPGVTPKPKTP